MFRFACPLLCSLLLMLPACTAELPEAIAASEAPQGEPIVFLDMLGDTVALAQPTRRNVTVPMPAGSLLMSLDHGPQHLAGMHPNAHELMRQGMLAKIFPAGLDVPADITRSGFAPNVETLLRIKPDLVWQWGHMGQDLLVPLREAGLPTAALLYGDESRTREWIRLMGLALGREVEANVQLRWREQVEQEITQALNGLSQSQRPAVLYLARYRPQYRVAGHDSNFEHDIVLAGGRNAAAEIAGTQVVNAEQILAWAPDVILLNNFEPGLTPHDIYADPLLADVPAVREHRVYKIPAGGYLWDPPSQESPLYWQWLAQILHPDRLVPSLRERIAQAYARLYGYSPASTEVDAVLHVTANGGAVGYERFR